MLEVKGGQRMSITDAEAIADVADRLFDAIENSDIALLQEMWNDDIVVWKVADHERDKERALRVITWFVNTTTDRRYEILDRQLFDGGFVQQHILHANGRNGGSISMRVCIVIKLGANGLISRIDEYFDPAEMAPLLER
jgi:ketosteroid isomerase-like protein